MKASEIYQLPVKSTTDELYGMYVHFPECREEDFESPTDGLLVHTYHYENFDGERYWLLAGLTLDGKPFMIVQNAGRGGQDHEARFITDPETYKAAVERLRKPTEPTDVIDPDADIAELTDFYGSSLSDFYDPSIDPKHKVGEIVTALVPENHCDYSNRWLPTRVEITMIRPTHPTSTYHGRQLDRAWVGNKIKDVEPGKGTIMANFNDGQVLEVLKRAEAE